MEHTGAAPERTFTDRSERGFSLVELITIVALLGALVIMAIPSYSSYMNSARMSRAMADMRTIEKPVTSFYIDRGSYPATLAATGDTTVIGLRDPWGNLYQYSAVDVVGYTPRIDVITQLNSDFDLYSNGPDGATTPDIADGGNMTGRDDIIRATDGAFLGKASSF